MSARRARLQERRDQALRDILDLEEQVADGEIPPDVAAGLLRRYETVAAEAIELLESLPADAPASGPRRSRATTVLYTAAAVVVVIAVAVLLPRSVAPRPEDGFVSGNEVAAPSAPSVSAAPDPLASVTDADLAARVIANPSALRMRLALAERYIAQGRFEQAVDHYTVALQQAPRNPRVQAGAGWVLYQLGRPRDAMRFVDQALALNPASADALWYGATIRLQGLDEPAAAVALLERLLLRTDLDPARREQAVALLATAREREQRGER
ncbi:MAG: tetratricopeptide repeat protein [Pseudonocardiaceae bacterium]